jgi:hypothetical protein
MVHLLHVVQPKLAKVVLLQRVELTRRDLVALEAFSSARNARISSTKARATAGGRPY